MNHRLEQYISRATRGLYGIKKLEVQAELRGNIEARIWQLEMQGNTNALKTALLEMGEASAVHAGLFKEHVMPNVSKALFVLVAGIGLTVATFSSSNAQVNWLESTQSVMFSSCRSFYISLTDFKTILEKAGATVTDTVSPFQKTIVTRRCQGFFMPPIGQRSGLTRIPSDINQPTRTLQIAFQSGGKTHQVILQASSNSLDSSEQPSKILGQAEYIPFLEVFSAFKSTSLPMRFEGWQRPKVQFGDFSFSLERPSSVMNPTNLYSSFFIDSVLQQKIVLPLQKSPIHNSHDQSAFPFRHSLKTNSPENTVFALLTTQGGFTASSSRMGATYLTILRANAQGILEFRSLFEYLEFSKSPDVTKITDVMQQNTGTNQFPARALLYKFTGRLDDAAKPVEIVLPSKTKIAALK